MLTLVEIAPVGRVRRKTPRQRDRKAAVRYGVSRRSQKIQRRTEDWVLGSGRFIAETVLEEPEALDLPLHQRPGLVRLGALAIWDIPGGVVFDKLDVLGEHLLPRAVVLEFLTAARREVWYGKSSGSGGPTKVASVQAAHRWRNLAGPSAVADALAEYKQAVTGYMAQKFEEMKADGDEILDLTQYLGSGPLRNTDLARSQAMLLRKQDPKCSGATIRRYLELHGYINTSDIVGRWHHEQLRRLKTNPHDLQQ
jgi:hypothetical protein